MNTLVSETQKLESFVRMSLYHRILDILGKTEDKDSFMNTIAYFMDTAKKDCVFIAYYQRDVWFKVLSKEEMKSNPFPHFAMVEIKRDIQSSQINTEIAEHMVTLLLQTYVLKTIEVNKPRW